MDSESGGHREGQDRPYDPPHSIAKARPKTEAARKKVPGGSRHLFVGAGTGGCLIPLLLAAILFCLGDLEGWFFSILPMFAILLGGTGALIGSILWAIEVLRRR